MPFDCVEGVIAQSDVPVPDILMPVAALPQARSGIWARIRSFLPQRRETPPSFVDVLRRAQMLLADPDDWTQNAYVRRRGNHLRHCAVGALRRAADDLAVSGSVYLVAYSTLAKVAKNQYGRQFSDNPPRTKIVERLNDRSNHAEVMQMFDRAINSYPVYWVPSQVAADAVSA